MGPATTDPAPAIPRLDRIPAEKRGRRLDEDAEAMVERFCGLRLGRAREENCARVAPEQRELRTAHRRGCERAPAERREGRHTGTRLAPYPPQNQTTKERQRLPRHPRPQRRRNRRVASRLQYSNHSTRPRRSHTTGPQTGASGRVFRARHLAGLLRDASPGLFHVRDQGVVFGEDGALESLINCPPAAFKSRG